MSSDFLDEFCERIGCNVPLYRMCEDCEAIRIANPETYECPKQVCDPGYCEDFVPYCICRDRILCTEEEVENDCDYPNCSRQRGVIQSK
jgi:hypothetical protein